MLNKRSTTNTSKAIFKNSLLLFLLLLFLFFPESQNRTNLASLTFTYGFRKREAEMVWTKRTSFKLFMCKYFCASCFKDTKVACFYRVYLKATNSEQESQCPPASTRNQGPKLTPEGPAATAALSVRKVTKYISFVLNLWAAQTQSVNVGLSWEKKTLFMSNNCFMIWNKFSVRIK